MKMLFSIVLLAAILCGCGRISTADTSDLSGSVTEETTLSHRQESQPAETIPESAPPETAAPTQPQDSIRRQVAQMSTEELIGQLFLVHRPAEGALEYLSSFHPGGYLLFGWDIQGQTPQSLQAMLKAYQAASPIPLLIAVDEEGGTVTRVSGEPAFRPEPFPSPRSLYAAGGTPSVLQAEREKAGLLRSLGINVNLAPVCDLCTDPEAFMYSRSLGLSPEKTGEVIGSMVMVQSEEKIGSVLKHFPGYGNNTDTHVAMALDQRPLSQLEQADLIPFQAGIRAGCDAIMVSHTIIEALDSAAPASLSAEVHRYLRETMGFDGVIITDDLGMQAVTDTYGAGEAAVLAVLAGNDLLCTPDCAVQYDAILQAVQNGRISEEILKESAERILRWKAKLVQTD